MNVDINDQALDDVLKPWDQFYHDTREQISKAVNGHAMRSIVEPTWDLIWSQIYIRVWNDLYSSME